MAKLLSQLLDDPIKTPLARMEKGEDLGDKSPRGGTPSGLQNRQYRPRLRLQIVSFDFLYREGYFRGTYQQQSIQQPRDLAHHDGTRQR